MKEKPDSLVRTFNEIVDINGILVSYVGGDVQEPLDAGLTCMEAGVKSGFPVKGANWITI